MHGSGDAFFFNHPATTEIYTLSLHDALPISTCRRARAGRPPRSSCTASRVVEVPLCCARRCRMIVVRSEEHTSELQSPVHLVCRLLLEKKKKIEYQRPKPESTTHLTQPTLSP